MPNWTDPAEYEFIATLSASRLAWEFLRRNPQYRTAWKNLPKGEGGQPTLAVARAAATNGKWLLAEMHDPARDDPPLQWTVGLHPRRLTRAPKVSDAYLGFQHSDHLVALGFDVGLDIHSQINNAKTLLLQIQQALDIKPDKSSHHKGNLKRHLRILDAEDAGASPKEIIAGLPITSEGLQMPHEVLKDLRKAARTRRDHTYWRFLILPQKGAPAV